jgi:hypothetical protein
MGTLVLPMIIGFKPLDRNRVFGRHEASRRRQIPCGRQSNDIEGFLYRHGEAEKRTALTCFDRSIRHAGCYARPFEVGPHDRIDGVVQSFDA